MKAEELRRIFKFRARMDALQAAILKADCAEQQRLAVERATLNLAMMRTCGICINAHDEFIVVDRDYDLQHAWTTTLQENLTLLSEGLLEHVLQGKV